MIQAMFPKLRPYATNNFYARRGAADSSRNRRYERLSKREEKSAKKRKLTAAEKKEIRAIMERARERREAPHAQDTLPFRQMFPDGLCKLDDNTWSKCIEFEDVNYRLLSRISRRPSLKASAICTIP